MVAKIKENVKHTHFVIILDNGNSCSILIWCTCKLIPENVKPVNLVKW